MRSRALAGPLRAFLDARTPREPVRFGSAGGAFGGGRNLLRRGRRHWKNVSPESRAAGGLARCSLYVAQRGSRPTPSITPTLWQISLPSSRSASGWGSTSSPGRWSCVHALIPLLPYLFLVRVLILIPPHFSVYLFRHPPTQPQWQAWHDRYGPKVCEQPPVCPPPGSSRTRASSSSSSSASSNLSLLVLVDLS